MGLREHDRPIVIGHRGVPGERLEHTRPSYLLALEQGVDYLEPDVVSTRDGVLVVRHENEIGGTTDVAERREFADRRATKVIDGVELDGWFTEDFTLEELKTLRTRERIPELRSQNVPLSDEILTLDEVLDIAEQADRPVGVYPETKHPTYFAGVGHDLDDLLLGVLERRGWDGPDADVVIQSMETGNLRRLRDRTSHPLIQLMEYKKAPYDLVAAGDPRTYADLATPVGLADVATYADGIGAHKTMVIARGPGSVLADPTGLVDDAHNAGLLVHIWTMRNENSFLPADLRSSDDPAAHGDARAEYLRFFGAGVDGVFSDQAATAVQAREQWRTR